MTTIGSLCSGYGGIELGLGQTWHDLTIAWHADPDKAAAALLAHRYPGVPNYGDLTSVDWSTVEPVDVITAGWPCQPFSMAGKRKGASDERAIWPAIADAIRIVRPRIVILENVVAVAGAGELARACADLAEAGYVGSWRSIRASDVGAPHKRDRLFVVAVATDPGCGSVQRRAVDPSVSGTPGTGVGEGLQRERWGPGTRHDGASVADTAPIRRDPGATGHEAGRPAGRGRADHRRSDAPVVTNPDGQVGRPVTAGPVGDVGGKADGRRAPDARRRGRPVADADCGGLEDRPECHGEPFPGFEASQRDDADRPVVADAGRAGSQGRVGAQPAHDQRPADDARGGSDAERGSRVAADPEGQRRREGWPEHAGIEGRPVDAFGSDTDWAEYGHAIERWSVILGRAAPAPTVLGRRGGPQLNPVFVEWVMGLPEGWVTGVPGLTRIQQLKLLGNGVVPRQCAVAVRSLLTILDENQVAA